MAFVPDGAGGGDAEAVTLSATDGLSGGLAAVATLLSAAFGAALGMVLAGRGGSPPLAS